MGRPANIETKQDAEAFVHYLLLEENLNYHPDTPFKDDVDCKGNQTYTPEQAVERERLLDQCFELFGDEVHEIGIKLQFSLLGLQSAIGPHPDFP